MAITNFTVEFKRKSSDGHGTFSKTSIGSYDVWLEQESVSAQRSIGSITNERNIPKGTFVLWSELDLKDCYIVIDGDTFPIVAADKFYDRSGEFHHIEGAYSY